MSLYDVLDQIIALLRQRKRVTYRLVKREFALDDETLADLKDELIYAQQFNWLRAYKRSVIADTGK